MPKFSMHKIASLIGAAAMAVTLQFAAATPSRANPWLIAALIGVGLLGLGVGAAVAYNRGYGPYGPAYGPGYGYTPQAYPVGYGGSGFYGTYGTTASADVSACMQRYRSYDVRTNTFLGRDGMRHPCTL